MCTRVCKHAHAHAPVEGREREVHPYMCKPGTLETLEPVFNERVAEEEGETAAARTGKRRKRKRGNTVKRGDGEANEQREEKEEEARARKREEEEEAEEEEEEDDDEEGRQEWTRAGGRNINPYRNRDSPHILRRPPNLLTSISQ